MMSTQLLRVRLAPNFPWGLLILVTGMYSKLHLPRRSNILRNLLFIPVTNVFGSLENHAKDIVVSEGPKNAQSYSLMSSISK